MFLKRTAEQGKRGWRAFPVILFLAALIVIVALAETGADRAKAGKGLVLRIADWKSGEIYAEAPVAIGDKVFFGWIHSLEKIPWNEYYYVSQDLQLVLDSITFPAFGAGIPENKGKVCYVKDGLIHMEQIEQTFPELVWLNSHSATREILVNDTYVAKGSELPQHTRLRLVIERSEKRGRQQEI